MTAGVATTTATGVKWGGASRVLTQVVQFSSIVVLARLVSPADFGLVAIVTTFVGFAMIFTNLGIGAFLVHRSEVEPVDLVTAFWLNAGSGALLTALFTAAALPMARAYGQPRLAALVVVGSLSFALSLGVVHTALLERQMRFKTLAFVEPSATGVSVLVAIGLAFAGFGAMALVIGHVVATVWKTGCLWWLVRWVPRGRPSRQSLRDLWAYSGALFQFNVANYWARNADNLLLGAVAGPVPLAFYSRAYTLMLIPVQQGTQVLGRVLFPALVRLRDDPVRLRLGYVRSLRVLAAVTFPLAVGLAAAAPAIVAIVLGSRWSGTAPLLTILSLSGPAQIVTGTTGALYQAIGRTDLQLKRGLTAAALLVAAISAGLMWGATGVAIAVSASYCLLMPVMTRPVWRLIGLRSRDALGMLLPIAVSAAGMGLAVWGVGVLLDRQDAVLPLVLLGQVTTGAVVYLALLRLLAAEPFRELRTVLLSRSGR